MSEYRSNIREKGMVAIMVTMILMIVISLIVLGFAQIARRNQRQALDRQLSTQAFYAAETGVNDAAELIQTATGVIPSKDDCADTGAGFYSSLITSSVLSSQNEVEYTCLTVDPDPASLVYSDVGTTGIVVPLTPVSGTISQVTLTWQSKDNSSTPATTCPLTKTNVFSSAASWTCGYGVLRFDLVRTDGSLSLSMGGLGDNTISAVVVPLRPGSAGDASPVNYPAPPVNGANSHLGRTCSQTECTVSINVPASSQYFLRVGSFYKDVSLQITASDGSGNVALQGAQAVIDSTGKAQDVLRRIQVRVPLRGTSNNLLSDWALQSSEAICKRFSVMDGYFQNDADNVISTNGIPAGGTANNLLCITP